MRAPGTETCWPIDGAHGQLEAVGGAGHAAARVALDDGTQVGVAAQGLPDGDGVGVEVEQLPAARHGGGEVAQVGEHELALDVGTGRCAGSAPSPLGGARG